MTGCTQGTTARPLDADDGAAFAAFTCRRYRQPWTYAVEEMVRDLVHGELVVGTIEGIGLWAGDELIGLAVWQVAQNPPGWFKSVLVAVASGHQGHGHARLLKQAVLDGARLRKAAVVVSEVHWDNAAMLHLNASFGASIERIPGDWEMCRCVIRLDA